MAAKSILGAAALLAFATGLWADDKSCIECHTNRERMQRALGNKDRNVDDIFVDRKKLAFSSHGGQACTDCHFDFVGFPHDDSAETAGCADCHEEAAKLHDTGIHGQTRDGNDKLPLSCRDCHSAHDVLPASERTSRMHPLNVSRTCGKCHFNDGFDAATASTEDLLNQHYMDDTHGHGLLKRGLTQTATCVSCHGSHDTKAKGDETSRVSRLHVHETCGKCHEGVLETYRKSVHAIARHDGKTEAATCTDCHHPHHIGTAGPEFRLASIKTCAECHEERTGTFRKTYHGKVAELGYGDVAADCVDCHGAHEILPEDHPQSHVSPDNLVATCGKCHEGAHEGFVAYSVHASWKTSDGDPLLHVIYVAMTWLLLGTFGFWGIHLALWLIRSLLAREWRHAPRSGRYIRRWRRFYVQLHIVFMTAFLLLTATGLPLHYSDQPWASRLMHRLGGPQTSSIVHRFAAVVMLTSILIYLVHIAVRAIARREKGLFWGPNTLIPQWRDLKDMVANVRWFLFLGKKPRYDRWTYWEKFDFWSVFWGIAIIGATGLILWFPVIATRVLPGWSANVAVIVHGHEALLAVGFIFSAHMFHSNLRPEKFPLDPLFATGRISEEEFLNERPDEYERAKAEGRLDELYVEAPTSATRRFAYIYGAFALLSGLLFLYLMIQSAF